MSSKSQDQAPLIEPGPELAPHGPWPSARLHGLPHLPPSPTGSSTSGGPPDLLVRSIASGNLQARRLRSQHMSHVVPATPCAGGCWQRNCRARNAHRCALCTLSRQNDRPAGVASVWASQMLEAPGARGARASILRATPGAAAVAASNGAEAPGVARGAASRMSSTPGVAASLASRQPEAPLQGASCSAPDASLRPNLAP